MFGAQPIVAILGSMDGESSVLNIVQSNISSMQSAMDPIEGDNHKNHLYSAHQGDIVQPRSMNNQDIQTEVVEDGVEEEGYELCLENSIFPEDIEDEDERREVLEDLYCLCEVFGHISVLWIEKDNGTCARPNQSDDITNIKDACPEYWMTIEFEYADDAEHAVATLNGMCVGGEYVQAGLYSYAAYLAGEFIDDHFIRIDDMSSETRNIYQETARGTVVAVRNYISKDDIDECAGDSVELSAIKRDLLALSSSHVGGGDTKNIFVSRVAIVCGTGKSSFNEMERKGDDTEGRHCPMEINSLTACVRFSSLRSAVDAMLSLDGTALGGTLLRASVRRSHLCLDDIHSAESIGEEIESAVGEDGIKGNSAIQKKEIVAFKKVSKISHSSPIQTATVDSSTSITTISLDVTPQLSDIVALNRKKKKKDKTDPSVSIYKQAVLAPKLDKCTRPRQRIKVACL